MHNLEILIIEDEKPAARSLTRKLEKLGYPVSQILHTIAQAKTWFNSNAEPDLIFMDIQLSDGLSFEIFDDVTIDSAIIFTTAYDEFALQAFKLNSIDYLLKPIREEELAFALHKFEKNQKDRNTLDLRMLKTFLDQKKEEYKTRFTIKIGQNLKIVDTKSIECFYAENKGTYLYSTDKQDFLVDYNLEQVEQMLDPKNFFRINRGCIINITSIKEIAIHSNSRLKVYLNTFQKEELIVSREKVNEFKNWLS